MAVLILSILFVVFSSAHVYAAAGQDAETSQWRPSEMDPSADKIIEGVELLPGTKDCGEPQCTFDLHYFYGGKEGRRVPNRKTIIYIPGGPGLIVDRWNRDLSFLEGDFNVIYFHVRGTGLSSIPKSNRYDRFLQAKYIAADVEKIRQEVMKERAEDGTETVRPWDAIYAHSYGTVVAQIYAHTYRDINAVSKLILSAPIARNIGFDNEMKEIEDTENARVDLIVSNLRGIYEYYRKDPCKKIESALSSLSAEDISTIKRHWEGSFASNETQIDKEIKEVIEKKIEPEKAKAIEKAIAKEILIENNKEFIVGTNDFCFVDPNLAQQLKQTLVDLIARYGSINFVTRYYDDLIVADPTFKTTYPGLDFFIAVDRLQFLGAPSIKDFGETTRLFRLIFDYAKSREQVDVGLLIGYYLASEPNPGNPCDESTQFLAPLIPSGVVGIGPPSYKTLYCRRIDAAKTLFAADGDGSKRAELVLGVQDGIVRWFFKQFSESLIPGFQNGDICLEGGSQGLAAILESPGVDEVVRRTVERMGAQGDFPICLWNPRKYKHNVSTLILKGQADPIIAGCQAEEVFKSGLEGERALIEFPGVGHSMVLPLVQDGEHDEKTLAIKGPDNTKIVGKFLETASVKDFKVELTEADPPKLAVLEALRATIWIAEGQSVSVWPAVPTSANTCFNPG